MFTYLITTGLSVISISRFCPVNSSISFCILCRDSSSTAAFNSTCFCLILSFNSSNEPSGNFGFNFNSISFFCPVNSSISFWIFCLSSSFTAIFNSACFFDNSCSINPNEPSLYSILGVVFEDLPPLFPPPPLLPPVLVGVTTGVTGLLFILSAVFLCLLSNCIIKFYYQE